MKMYCSIRQCFSAEQSTARSNFRRVKDFDREHQIPTSNRSRGTTYLSINVFLIQHIRFTKSFLKIFEIVDAGNKYSQCVLWRHFPPVLGSEQSPLGRLIISLIPSSYLNNHFDTAPTRSDAIIASLLSNAVPTESILCVMHVKSPLDSF